MEHGEQGNLPPILILMCDQQRADALSCAGHPLLRTPHMDRLCGEGVRFSRACSVSPICMPARASFVSGLYPHNHGMWDNRGEMPPDDETFFHHLQRAGYHVTYVGKSHFYPHTTLHMREREGYMRRRGIDTVHETTGPWSTVRTRSYMTDHWETKGLWKVYQDDYERRRVAGSVYATWPSPLPEDEFPDSYVGGTAVRMIEEYKGDKPLCLFVGFGGPHEPWDPPGRYAEMYDPAACPAPIPAAELPSSLPPRARERLAAGLHDIPPEQARKIRALYYGKVSLLDDWFGRILAAYDRRGWLDQALVIHWSDHGEMLCDHARLHKCVFYDSSLRIQFNIRWPGRVPAGVVCDSLVETVDAFPTILEAIGAPPSKRCLGRSLWPCLRDPKAAVRDAAFSEIHDTTMVLTRDHKYACDSTGQGYMLFDVRNDRLERTNLIGTPGAAEVECGMRARLLEFLLRAQVKL